MLSPSYYDDDFNHMASGRAGVTRSLSVPGPAASHSFVSRWMRVYCRTRRRPFIGTAWWARSLAVAMGHVSQKYSECGSTTRRSGASAGATRIERKCVVENHESRFSCFGIRSDETKLGWP